MSTKDAEKSMDSVKKNLTDEDVIDVAKKITNDNDVRVLDYSLSDYSKDKLGFTASHHILNITVQKSNENNIETISAFVKIVFLPVLDDLYKNIDINSMITAKETFLLKTLVSQFMDSYKSERWWPEHYHTTNNIIIMEDLKSNGYKTIEDFIDNYVVIKSVLAALARFHSCSILAEARMSQDSKCSKALNEQYKDGFPESMFLREGEEGASWFASTTKLTCALAEHFGYDSEKVRKLYDSVCDMVKPSKVHRNVICHGDVHSKNLMFAEGSTLPHCILVDFQTFRYAPMVTDVLQFLYINTTKKFREQHEAELIEFYHSVLKESIEHNDSTNTAEVPTLAEISKGMDDLRVFGLVIASIYHPVLFIDPELMRRHARDSEFNQNLVLGDRTDLTFTHMKDNEFFRNKVEEAIRELVENSP